MPNKVQQVEGQQQMMQQILELLSVENPDLLQPQLLSTFLQQRQQQPAFSKAPQTHFGSSTEKSLPAITFGETGYHGNDQTASTHSFSKNEFTEFPPSSSKILADKLPALYADLPASACKSSFLRFQFSGGASKTAQDRNGNVSNSCDVTWRRLETVRSRSPLTLNEFHVRPEKNRGEGSSRRFDAGKEFMSPRQAANFRERRRMQTLNRAFDRLRYRIPVGADKRLTKVDTLRVAAVYIRHLVQLLEENSPVTAAHPTNSRLHFHLQRCVGATGFDDA